MSRPVDRVAKVVAVLILLSGLVIAPASAADREGQAAAESTGEKSVLERDTLTGGWFGAGRSLEDRGLWLGLGLTEVYQRNVHDSLAAGVGKWSGSYDLEARADLQKALGLRGGEFYLLAEGAWTGSRGLDARAVGSVFGINDDLGGERTMDVTELWYQRGWQDGRLRLRLGKLDLTAGFECRTCPGTFDGNLYANDETTQFLNSALVNNPAVSFPDNGLGAAAYGEVVPGWYVSAAVADAEADATEAGISTTFDGDTHLFYVLETGLMPVLESENGGLPGGYRLGLWNERQPKEYLDGTRTKRDDTGVYLSAGQMVWREVGGEGEPQGLGVFGRAGWADDRVNEIKTFASAGLSYRGLLPGRDSDVAALGVAQGRLSRHAGFSSSFERVVELYYNAEVTPWFHLSPAVQWVSHAGGRTSDEDAVVVGFRAQAAF